MESSQAKYFLSHFLPAMAAGAATWANPPAQLTINAKSNYYTIIQTLITLKN